jgi:DNA repair exonuclease SbcCD ATPase subunit
MRREGFAEEMRRQEEVDRELKKKQEEADRELKRKQEAARQKAEQYKAENARRRTVMQERTARKECPLCGKALGLWDRLKKRGQHGGCRAFRE